MPSFNFCNHVLIFTINLGLFDLFGFLKIKFYENLSLCKFLILLDSIVDISIGLKIVKYYVI